MNGQFGRHDVLARRQFAGTLAGADAWLKVDRYRFIVVDLHHLLLAGVDRRTVVLEFCM
jgi:hypothetical protein